MAAAHDRVPSAPSVIERFVRQLLVTNKAVALYPPSSTIPRDTAEDAVLMLREALRENSDVRLVITKQGLQYEEADIFPGQTAFTAFAYELYKRRLADVRFHAGSEAHDIIAFLEVAKSSAAEIAASGGFEARMWDHNVGTITVTEVQTTLVEADPDSGALSDEVLPRPGRREIDLLLEAPLKGGSRDHMILSRVIGQPSTVRDYLREIYADPGRPADMKAVGERFTALAQAALDASPEDRDGLMSSLAKAVWELEPPLRRELVVEHILPESRASAALAAVARQMSVDEICRLLVEGLATGQTSREGLVRAIRNLALISMADRDDVINAAGAAMLGAGMGESAISDVLEGAAPSHLTVGERASGSAATERPVDSIFRLLELAPFPSAAREDESSELAALREEARRGITDGDIIGALASLVSMDTREAQFASTMSRLEDSLDLLIARGDLDVAADAAASLIAAAENPELTGEQQLRIRRCILRFAQPRGIREIASALQLYKSGTAEYDSAHRLLETLGPLAIQPLLEQLADEADMAARKGLVDLVTQLARNYIPELGVNLSDHRWYFVRNVVGILGSTKSSAALPYLERTLRHNDPRVRRETIRGLSSIHDRLATEMLVAALSDEDAQNVQLSARFLGSSGVRGAVPALEVVARGDGRGNRENGPRVEAIEALGNLRATESLPLLESLAGARKLLGAGRARELRTAAESAISRIRSEDGAR